jgi:hypothetical protein
MVMRLETQHPKQNFFQFFLLLKRVCSLKAGWSPNAGSYSAIIGFAEQITWH